MGLIGFVVGVHRGFAGCLGFLSQDGWAVVFSGFSVQQRQRRGLIPFCGGGRGLAGAGGRADSWRAGGRAVF